MPHILKNNGLRIQIDLPHENYSGSRFDWTGKIAQVFFKGISISGVEQLNSENQNQLGKGFYNEFGIDTALGFDETEIGGWFHKIGVGLLKKDDHRYLFNKKYEIKPAVFEHSFEPDRVLISSVSELVNGYSYKLNKEIKILDSGFTINSQLKNTGRKAISTSEYVHNFIAMNKELIGRNYILKFPFTLNPDRFQETVNPENKVEIRQTEFCFNGTPQQQFFFSKLAGDTNADANWELRNLNCKIAISETGNFQTNKVNLWGCKHVISPELFFEIFVKPGASLSWTRTYALRFF